MHTRKKQGRALRSALTFCLVVEQGSVAEKILLRPTELTGAQRQIVAEHSRPKVYTKAEAVSMFLEQI